MQPGCGTTHVHRITHHTVRSVTLKWGSLSYLIVVSLLVCYTLVLHGLSSMPTEGSIAIMSAFDKTLHILSKQPDVSRLGELHPFRPVADCLEHAQAMKA